MNKFKLKEAEEKFFMMYPGGFSNPEMKEIAKKHKVEKMNELTKRSFSIEQFDNPKQIVESMVKIVNQSSLVSIFEKPKFKEAVNTMDDIEKEHLAQGLKEFLHGDQKIGFELMVSILNQYKIAKWPILTVIGVYYRPSVEVLVKPTTAKSIVNAFELEGIYYSPKPNYEFYQGYKEQINLIKKEVNSSLGYDNAAFCGFLMMTLEN